MSCHPQGHVQATGCPAEALGCANRGVDGAWRCRSCRVGRSGTERAQPLRVETKTTSVLVVL